MHHFVEKLRHTVDSLKLSFELLSGIFSDCISIDDIRNEVTFKADTITTARGEKVLERRETCWMADSGVGGLAYSGKIMSPVPFSSSIAKVRDIVEEETGIRYDCALINRYPDGETVVSLTLSIFLI